MMTPCRPVRVLIDRNIVDALFNDPDAAVLAIRLQGSAAIRLLITHLQEDQLAKAPHHIRKTVKLLNPATAGPSSAIWRAATDWLTVPAHLAQRPSGIWNSCLRLA